jgi:hypothetical protein
VTIVDIDLRELFHRMLSCGTGNVSSVFKEEEQNHPWLRPHGLVGGFCSTPPLGAKGCLKVFDEMSEGQLDDEYGCLRWQLAMAARQGN